MSAVFLVTIVASATVLAPLAAARQPTMSHRDADRYVPRVVRHIYAAYAGTPGVSRSVCHRRTRTAFRCSVTFSFRASETVGTMNLSYHGRPSQVAYSVRGRNHSTMADLGSIPVHYRGHIPAN